MKTKLCALLLAVVMLVPLSGCKRAAALLTATAVLAAYDAALPDAQRYATVLERNWEISLPKGFELICSEEIPSPHGDGYRYAVLRYEDSSVLDDFQAWTGKEGATYSFDSYTELTEQAIDALSIPGEFHPTYGEHQWFYTCRAKTPWDEILMIRSGDLLYIIQSFV